jgi:hypothetical protein
MRSKVELHSEAAEKTVRDIGGGRGGSTQRKRRCGL